MPKSFFMKKIIKNIPVMLALNNKYGNKGVKSVSNFLNFDYKG